MNCVVCELYLNKVTFNDIKYLSMDRWIERERDRLTDLHGYFWVMRSQQILFSLFAYVFSLQRLNRHW